ncbi:MAG: AraC family transcriptional regulator [Chlorobi bacterium]|nr:AraC family transcriptional regulator [Chlorobiota bacterium]
MNHIERIQRALDFIEENILGDLPLESIAREAAFSVWHFQRIFGALVGESVRGYVRGRRLTLAARELAGTGKKIGDVAWDHGFESQEAFTRAFKARFGITPGECRRSGIESARCIGRPRITEEYLLQRFGGITMEPTIKVVGEMNLVGLGKQFISILSPDANSMQVLPMLWDEFNGRIGEIRNPAGDTRYGLCDALSPEMKRTHEDEFYYMACTEVQSLDAIPEGMTARTIPEQRYAVFTHKGPLHRLGETMNYVYGSWRPNAPYEMSEGPDLELYDERFNPTAEDSEMDILIPIK